MGTDRRRTKEWVYNLPFKISPCIKHTVPLEKMSNIEEKKFICKKRPAMKICIYTVLEINIFSLIIS
jgi:hypothetical protein